MPHRLQQILMCHRRHLSIVVSQVVVKKTVTVRPTEIVWAKATGGVWGLANVFANGKLYVTRDVPEANCLPQGLPPKLPNLVPNPSSVQPNLLPRWQPSLQPNLQLESPFLLSMCSSQRSNTHVKKSGTPNLLLSRPDMHPCTQFPGHFVVHMPSCLHLLFCVARPLSSNRGGGGNHHLGCVPSGV